MALTKVNRGGTDTTIARGDTAINDIFTELHARINALEVIEDLPALLSEISDTSFAKDVLITPLDLSSHFGATSLVYTSTTLPTGLVIASGTGIITGTPTAQSVTAVVVTATNGNGAVDSNSFNITITL